MEKRLPGFCEQHRITRSSKVMNCDTSSSSSHKIMTFNPTLEEMRHFSVYIRYMEAMGAHKAGIAKVVPPSGYQQRRGGYGKDIESIVINNPVVQTITDTKNTLEPSGLYQQTCKKRPSMTVGEFRRLAKSSRYKTPSHKSTKHLEQIFWQDIGKMESVYGLDISGSLADKDLEVWNLNKLDTILDLMKKQAGQSYEGVNSPYLYFGMWGDKFCWHTEDVELYSINYLHFGAPKTWYAIPPQFGFQFEEIVAKLFPLESAPCKAFMKHRNIMISPEQLTANKIPFDSIVHERGEFMITFPFGYHCGYNHGYNYAESLNFATERWIEYGKRSRDCKCFDDFLKIDMEVFVKKFQPTNYENWLTGKDWGFHPESPGEFSFAGKPDDEGSLATNLIISDEPSNEYEEGLRQRELNVPVVSTLVATDEQHGQTEHAEKRVKAAEERACKAEKLVKFYKIEATKSKKMLKRLQLVKPVQSKDKKFSCKLCLKVYNSSAARSLHEQTHAPTGTFACSQCPHLSFANNNSLRKHLLKQHCTIK